VPRIVTGTLPGDEFRIEAGGKGIPELLLSRLDELASGKPVIVRIFIAATLVGLVISQAICAAMRAERPRCEPSLHRVFALILVNIAVLVNAVVLGTLRQVLPSFIAALWREGLNPNPGRPYAFRRHLATVGA
jgi:hypothetical protein